MVSPLPNQPLPGFMQNFNMQGPAMPTFGAADMSDAGVRNIMDFRNRLTQRPNTQAGGQPGFANNEAFMKQYEAMMKRYEAAMANREEQMQNMQDTRAAGMFDFASMFGGPNYGGPAGSGSSFQQPQQEQQQQQQQNPGFQYGGSMPGGISYGGPAFGSQGSRTQHPGARRSSQFFY